MHRIAILFVSLYFVQQNIQAADLQTLKSITVGTQAEFFGWSPNSEPLADELTTRSTRHPLGGSCELLFKRSFYAGTEFKAISNEPKMGGNLFTFNLLSTAELTTLKIETKITNNDNYSACGSEPDLCETEAIKYRTIYTILIDGHYNIWQLSCTSPNVNQKQADPIIDSTNLNFSGVQFQF